MSYKSKWCIYSNSNWCQLQIDLYTLWHVLLHTDRRKNSQSDTSLSVIHPCLKWIKLSPYNDKMTLLNDHVCTVCKTHWHQVDSNTWPLVYKASILALYFKMEIWITTIANIIINKHDMYTLKLHVYKIFMVSIDLCIHNKHSEMG